MKRGMVVESLPDSLLREIGRVIFAHAVLENHITGFAHAALQVSRKEGRIAVREPRLTDRFEMILDLMTVHKVDCTVDTTVLRKRIEDCSRQRDQLAHGIWVQVPDGRTLLRLTKGSWQPVKGQKAKRLITPQGIEFGEQDGIVLASFIQQTTHILVEMSDEVLPQIASSRDKWRIKLAQQNESENHSD